VTTYSSVVNNFVKLKCTTPTAGTYLSEVDNTYFSAATIWGVQNSIPGYPPLIRVIKYDPVNDVIYIGGYFDRYRGVQCTRNLIRIIASTGAIDPTFNGLSQAGIAHTLGLNGSRAGVHDIQIDGNGKIVVAGCFSRVYFFPVVSVLCSHIIRLNYDGTQDTSFAVSQLGNTGFPQYIVANNPSNDYSGLETICISNDGSDDIYAGGAFYAFKNQSRRCIVKIKNNGDIAPLPEFNPGTGFSNAWYKPVDSYGFQTGATVSIDDVVINKIIYQNDKLLVGGNFGLYNGTVVNALLRMDAYGVIDPTFTKDTLTYIPITTTTTVRRVVYDIKVTNTGNILIAGALTAYLSTANTNHYYVLGANGNVVYGANMTTPGLSPYGDYAFRISTYEI